MTAFKCSSRADTLVKVKRWRRVPAIRFDRASSARRPARVLQALRSNWEIAMRAVITGCIIVVQLICLFLFVPHAAYATSLDEAAALDQRVIQFFKQGRYSEAAEQLAKSRTMTPELLYMLCDSYFHVGKVSDADLTAETIAAYGRNNPQVINDLIALLHRNGQEELAKRLSASSTQK